MKDKKDKSSLTNFDRVYETLPGNGWLSREEAELLYKWLYKTKGPVLEVGCFQGRSTVLLAAAGRMVYCVDPFDNFHSELSGDEIEKRFQENLAGRKINNVRLFRQRIEDWKHHPIGLAYLDGDHTFKGTLTQVEVAVACKASVIAVHDVNDTGGGMEVNRACRNLLGDWDERVERLAIWNMETRLVK